MCPHRERFLVDVGRMSCDERAMPEHFSALRGLIGEVLKAGFHAWIGKMLAKCLYVGLGRGCVVCRHYTQKQSLCVFFLVKEDVYLIFSAFIKRDEVSACSTMQRVFDPP